MTMRATACVALLLLAGCEAENEDGPRARAMRDDLGGRLFFIESDGRHDNKRSTLIVACHGDGDNIVMFKTAVERTAAPTGPVMVDYRVGQAKGQAEARWNGTDIWLFADSRFAQQFAKLFLQTGEASIGFPEQTGARHKATWRRTTAADLREQINGWCKVK